MGVSQILPFTASGDPNGVTWSLFGTSFPARPAWSPLPAPSPPPVASTGNYTGPGGVPSFYATVIATSKTDPTKSASATINVVAPGTFTATNNLQVAQYSVGSSFSRHRQRPVWPRHHLRPFHLVPSPPPVLGAPPLSLYVAGMKQSTPYHMHGLIQFADGTSFSDSDNTFTTGALPAGTVPEHHRHHHRRYDPAERSRTPRNSGYPRKHQRGGRKRL